MAKKRNKNKKSVKTTKKQAKLKKDNNSDIKMNKLVKDERTHKVLGIFCLLLSAFLAIAFISYLFTWKADQGLVHRYGAGILLMKNLSLNNLLGRLGAFISHVFFYEGVGLSSFLLCYLLGILGVNFITGKKMFNIWRNVRHVIFGLVYISTALSIILNLLFPEAQFPWGGALGDLIVNWLIGFIGVVGAILLWIVVGIAYGVWRYNINLVPRRPAILDKAKEAVTAFPEDTPNDRDQDVVPQYLGRKDEKRHARKKDRKSTRMNS